MSINPFFDFSGYLRKDTYKSSFGSFQVKARELKQCPRIPYGFPADFAARGRSASRPGEGESAKGASVQVEGFRVQCLRFRISGF